MPPGLGAQHNILGSVPTTLNPMLLQKIRDTNGTRMTSKCVVYILPPTQGRACFFKSMVIQMWGCIAIFLENAVWPGVDVTFRQCNFFLQVKTSKGACQDTGQQAGRRHDFHEKTEALSLRDPEEAVL